jgi:hypothetical protein
MRAPFPNGRSQRRNRSRRTIESDNRRESPCTNRHAQAGPVFGLYPPLHAPEPPAARPKPTCRNTSSLIGSMSEASSLSTFELFTRFDTAHRCKYSFETDFNSSMPCCRSANDRTGQQEHGHPVVDFCNKVIRVADYHRARFDAFARFFFFNWSQRPATVSTGEPSRAVKYQGCFPFGVSCHS